METLAALAALRPRVRGLFTDVDDTLTHEGVLVPAAYAAVCRAVAAGLRVVLVTGRPAGWAAVLAATWPVDAAIAENGAVYFARGARAPVFWDDAETRARQQVILTRLRDDLLARLPFARPADDQWLRRCDAAFDIGERQQLAPEEIAALLAAMRAHGVRTTSSSVHAHAYLGDHDKATMCARVARDLWAEDWASDASLREPYVYVGDSANDQPGFAMFARSVGVANIARHLHALAPPPRYLTPSPGGHGFAELVAALLG